jgi:hypothetical protein
MKNKRIPGLLTFLVLLIPVLGTWSVSPNIGPLMGTNRSTLGIINYIDNHNILTLVNPLEIIGKGNNSYHDWAFEEFKERAFWSMLFWVCCVISAQILIKKKQTIKEKITRKRA